MLEFSTTFVSVLFAAAFWLPVLGLLRQASNSSSHKSGKLRPCDHRPKIKRVGTLGWAQFVGRGDVLFSFMRSAPSMLGWGHPSLAAASESILSQHDLFLCPALLVSFLLACLRSSKRMNSVGTRLDAIASTFAY